MARTIRLERVPPAEWDPSFREPWLELLERTGAAVSGADCDALEAARRDLDALAASSRRELPDGLWPVSGRCSSTCATSSTRFDEVAGAQPVAVPAPALTRFFFFFL